MRDIVGFLKKEGANRKVISTGHKLLDRAFGIPLESFMLIKGEPYAGATALAFEIGASLSKSGKTVIYCDVFNYAIEHRLHGINPNNFFIFRPFSLSPDEFLEVANTICNTINDPVFILDNLGLLERDWGTLKLSDLAKRIRSYHKEATIIATQRNGKVDSLWSYVVTVEHIENVYNTEDGESIWKGHTAKVRGLNGLSKIYIEYETGRISKAFEHAKLEVENGKAKTANFELDGIKQQGHWQFIHEYNRRLKNGI